MTASAVFLLVPTVCYLGAAVAYALKGFWPLAITYACYAGANVGLLMLDRQTA